MLCLQTLKEPQTDYRSLSLGTSLNTNKVMRQIAVDTPKRHV
jgi:hypothetical protein